MIDYIKAYFKDKNVVESNLLRKDCLHKVVAVHNFQKKNEYEHPIRAKIGNMFVNISEKQGYVENSLHKHFNALTGEEVMNYDDFYYCDLLSSLEALESELNYPLEDMSLTNLEFGFNIDLGFDPTTFLNHNLLMYNLKTPCVDPKNKKNMKLKKFSYTNYEIKVYDKSLHYGLKHSNPNILRIEVKYKSKKELNGFNIYTLEDLKDINNLYLLFGDFLKKFEQLIIVDSYYGDENMSKREQRFFKECLNYQYWVELKRKYHKNTFGNKFRAFKKLIKDYELDQWKSDLRLLIVEKFNQLITSDCDNLTTYTRYVA
ncbi:MAG: hypothetical protein Tsb0033_15400 [Winogradskyella sp.]